MQRVRTVLASGAHLVRVPPSKLVMIGRLVASKATLANALEHLTQRRHAATKWLERMEASHIAFGLPRFPNQQEPSMATRLRSYAASRTATTSESSFTTSKRVIQGYTATWPLEDASAEEMLLMVDRIQFEASSQFSLPTTDAPPTAESPSLEWYGKIAAMTTPELETDQFDFLFLSSLEGDAYDAALTAACHAGQKQAHTIAKAAGITLGALQSVHCTPDHDSSTASVMRRETMPTLLDAPLSLHKFERLSENPQPAAITVSVLLTFEFTD